MIRLTMTKRQLVYWLAGLTTVPVLVFAMGVLLGVGIHTRLATPPLVAVNAPPQSEEIARVSAPTAPPSPLAAPEPLAQAAAPEPFPEPWDLEPAAGGTPMQALAVAPALAEATVPAAVPVTSPTETPAIDASVPEAAEVEPLPTAIETVSLDDTKAPQTDPSAVAGHLYEVQVGSFADEDKARAFAGQLNEKGYQAFTLVLADPNGGRTLYKVRFGQYPQRAEADAAAKQYRQQEKAPAFIIAPAAVTAAAAPKP